MMGFCFFYIYDKYLERVACIWVDTLFVTSLYPQVAGQEEGQREQGKTFRKWPGTAAVRTDSTDFFLVVQVLPKLENTKSI